MRFAMMLMVLAPLVGCAQYDEMRSANLAAAQRERTAADEATCRANGAQPGSPAYEDCRDRLLRRRDKAAYRQEKVARDMLNESSLRPIGE
jgi:hypothetical protein